MTPKILTRFVAAALPLAFFGCTLMDDWGHDEPRRVVGLKVSELRDPVRLALWKNRLVVACGMRGESGVAVVDTSADTVLSFYSMGGQYGPATMTFLDENRAAVPMSFDGVRILDLAQGTQESVLQGQNRIYSSGGRFFTARETPFAPTPLREGLAGDAPTLGTLPSPHALAVSGGRFFMTSDYRRSLLYGDFAAGFDSLDLPALAGDTNRRIEALLAHGGRLFAGLTAPYTVPQRADSAVIAVLDAQTLALEKTIPLSRQQLDGGGSAAPRVRDGIWYVISFDFWGSSGRVEAVDLDTRVRLQVRHELSRVQGFEDYLPIREGYGYLISLSEDGARKAQRIPPTSP